jgi:thiol-disulfide isomerase/thioredoxin
MLVAVVKRDCETCKLVEPVLAQIASRAPLSLYSQDDPTFPEALGGARDDTALERSWRLRIETVPTLIRFDGENEVARIAGWDRAEWDKVAQQTGLGAGLPAFQPAPMAT